VTGKLLINLSGFYLGWFACVLGGAWDRPWWGVAGAAGVIAVHLVRVARPAVELRLILLAGLLGAVLDSLPIALGLVRYPAGTLVDGFAPVWLIALWMVFATTLNVTLRGLKRRPLLAALLGAVGGPLAYYGGAGLGGVVFTPPAAAGLFALAVLWGAAMPILMILSSRCDGVAETGPSIAEPTGSATADTPE